MKRKNTQQIATNAGQLIRSVLRSSISIHQFARQIPGTKCDHASRKVQSFKRWTLKTCANRPLRRSSSALGRRKKTRNGRGNAVVPAAKMTENIVMAATGAIPVEADSLGHPRSMPMRRIAVRLWLTARSNIAKRVHSTALLRQSPSMTEIATGTETGNDAMSAMAVSIAAHRPG